MSILTSQETSSNGEESYVIKIKNACLHYDAGSYKVPVLTGLNMHVPKGSIFGLLGPSGCGKTTLINCIVGRKKLTSGELTVFGRMQLCKGSGVSGSRIGYMPQELGLVCELTIREMLLFYGLVFYMSKDKIKSRTDFLIDMLDLPKEDRPIINLSGGQQRRVSLAVALLCEPELLILDEPTVGVDPILRKIIWSHLLEITRASHFQTTIVITTHFIEEARQADVIGMMRFGKLLAEGSPSDLLLLYNKMTLEEVFMHLCLGDEKIKQRDRAQKIKKLPALEFRGINYEADVRTKVTTRVTKLEELAAPIAATVSSDENLSHKNSNWSYICCFRIMALVMRNVHRITRNTPYFIFLFILPSILFTLFYVGIGHDPRGLTIAIFNEDTNTVSCHNGSYTHDCLFQNNIKVKRNVDERAGFSCQYLSYLDRNVIHPVFYDSLSDALQMVKSGKHIGIIHFKENFTDSLHKRFLPTILMPPQDDIIFDQTDIHIMLDYSNQVTGHFTKFQLVSAYQDFLRGFLDSCHLNGNAASLPMTFNPVYESVEPTMTAFATPGCILVMIYFLSVAHTSLSLITDKKDGVTDRDYVAGVRPAEVLISLLSFNFIVTTVQVILMLTIMMVVFQDHVEGPLACCMFLVIFQGVCGMSFGLLISALFDREHEALMVAVGIFFGSFFICGIIWPLEGMPRLLQNFSSLLPNTLACEALRGIISRGWDFWTSQVITACLVTLAWIMIHLAISVTILRIRR